jgi:DNA-binding NarL/FixJ family response regulator
MRIASKDLHIGFVDDHPLVLDGICEIASSRPGLVVSARGTTVEDALTIARSNLCDVLVCDLGLPGDIIDAVRQLTHERNRTRIIIYTASSQIENCVAALEAGARGYVLKGSHGSELFTAIAEVAAGQTFITPVFASTIIMSIRRGSLHAEDDHGLTRREDQIVDELMLGLSNREIADKLHMSEKTVKYHMTQIMQKLNVRNRLEVVIEDQRTRGRKPAQMPYGGSAGLH